MSSVVPPVVKVENMSKVYYYIKECPIPEDCSAQAFKRAGIWDHTDADCRIRLVNHLMNSSKHNLDRQEAMELAEMAEVLQCDMEDDVPQARAKKARYHVDDRDEAAAGPDHREQQQQPRKLQPRPPLEPPSILTTSSHGLIAEVAAAAAAAATAAAAAATQAPITVNSGGSGGSSSRDSIVKATRNAMLDARGDIVCLNAETARLAIDALERASVAARHAQRLCSAAASAFSTEAAVIDEAKTIMKGLLNQ